MTPPRLILYSKPGCHLCQGLQEKLEQIQDPAFTLEVRDITSREDWFQAYQYEVPVLFGLGASAAGGETPQPLPRPAPRATIAQVQRMLQRYLGSDQAE